LLQLQPAVGLKLGQRARVLIREFAQRVLALLGWQLPPSPELLELRGELPAQREV